MKFRTLIILLLLASGKVFSGTDRNDPYHWSVVKSITTLDSLKNAVRKSPLTAAENFSQYVRNLEFREYFKNISPLPSTFPISSGIYDGNLKTDSLSAFHQQLFLLRTLGDVKAEADLLSRYGIHYSLLGENQKGMDLLKQSVILFEQIDDQPGILKNTLFLAKVARFQGDLTAATKFNNQVINFSASGMGIKFLGESYLNLSEIMIFKKEYKAAEQLILKKTLPLVYYKLKDKEATMKCFEQLASLYEVQKRYSEAKWFYIQSNMLARTSRNTPGIVRSLSKLAHVKMAIGDTDLAIKDYKEAETLAKVNKYQLNLIEIKSDLSEAYRKVGRIKESELAKSEFMALQTLLLQRI